MQQQKQKQKDDVDVSYILQLESRIRMLEAHHRNCTLQNPTSLPSPVEPSRGSAIELGLNLEARGHNTQPEITFINSGISQTKSIENSVKGSKPQRWVKSADNILDSSHNWNELGITSQLALADVFGSLKNDESNSSLVIQGSDARYREELLPSLKRYAKLVKGIRAAAKLALLTANYQSLVFVSICVVLENHNIFNSDIVDGLLRDGVGTMAQSKKHLDNLKKGARWANELIDALSWVGWGRVLRKSSSSVSLCIMQNFSRRTVLIQSQVNITPAKCAAFADAPNFSLPYFVERLKRREGNEHATVPEPVDFSIPLLVQRFTGDLLE